MSLCLSCSNCVVAKTVANVTMVKCYDFGNIIDTIEECSAYRDKNQPSEYQLEKIAWEIDPKKKGAAGFKPPEKEN